ncbi:hypothetical protein M8J76_002186 [Diaphorina citri]|nr:hypothetical protein M8J76_002186 [Diaphorina citri]
MNYRNIEIIHNFLPLYYLSKIFGVFPLILLTDPGRSRGATQRSFWSRFRRGQISDPGDDRKDDILEKFKSYKTYLKETSGRKGHQLRIFRLDCVSLVYTYISICVVILHGISAPFYVLHTTLPLQYNDSIFNIDFDEDEEEEEDVQLTTLRPVMGEEKGVWGNATADSIKFAENIVKNSINKRSVDRLAFTFTADQDIFNRTENGHLHNEEMSNRIQDEHLQNETNSPSGEAGNEDLVNENGDRSSAEILSKNGNKTSHITGTKIQNRARSKTVSKTRDKGKEKEAQVKLVNENGKRSSKVMQRENVSKASAVTETDTLSKTGDKRTKVSIHATPTTKTRIPRSNATLTAETRIPRSVQTYRNSFNRTHGNITTNWRTNNNYTGHAKRPKPTNTTDAANITKPANETTASDPLMYDKETKQSLSMKIANPLMITAMCLASKFTCIVFIPKNLDTFFSQLLIVDKILAYHPKFHANQKRFMQNLLIYSFLLSVPINIHYLLTVIEVNNEFGIMWCCILIYTNLSSFLLDLHFIYLNYLLLIRYKYINREIQSAFNNYSNNVILVQRFLIYDYLEILRECHKTLSDLLKLLNYIYQIHLLIALSACFAKLLFNIYFAMFGYVIGTAVPHSDKEATELFRTVLWSMYYAMRFICVVLSADLTGQQARNTCVILANVNNRHLDSNTKEELSLFGSYITSRNLTFTAAGFFTLNTHLITSAISTGTTYLVILVQFHGQKL